MVNKMVLSVFIYVLVVMYLSTTEFISLIELLYNLFNSEETSERPIKIVLCLSLFGTLNNHKEVNSPVDEYGSIST